MPMEKHLWNDLTYYQGIRGFHAFLNGISLKTSIIAQLEFERAYFEVAVQHISHYTTKTTP